MRTGLMVVMLAALTLSACGKSEADIRAEERARMLDEMKAMKALQEDAPPAAAAAPAEAAAAPASAPASAASPKAQSRIVGDSGPAEIGRYYAWIGDDDLYNSQGQRLTKVWQVLRQDRANFHKYGVSQPGDEADRFFASERNRAIMESMVRNGSIDRAASQRLLAGNVSVEVRILGRGETGESVSVTVR